MKFINNYITLFLFAALLISSCSSDIEIFTPTTNTPNLGRIVTVDMGGTVVDEQGQPLEDVEITLGNESTVTDENGIFLFRNASTNDRRAYITANKAGYFEGSRTMIVQDDKLHFATIRLLEREIIQTFQSNEPAEVQFDNVTLSFPANGIMLEGGGDYTGAVNVAAKYLNPNDDNLSELMPGDLRGINASGAEVVLATFGMMTVDLIGENGEALQVATGSEVAVETVLPADFLGNAPATIPLWSFDEAEGIWAEEGEAVLDGNIYRGVVTHFSFWNHDFPYPLINVKGQILNENGDPLSNVPVQIQVVGEKYLGYGTTNEDGFFCGLIPENFELEITVFGSGPCNRDVLYMENIGSHSTDLILAPITITPAPGTTINATFSGRLVDCDDNPVTNGYVRGIFNNRWFTLFVDEADGTFNQNYIFCDLTNDLEIKGFDLDNLLESDAMTFAVEENIVVGDLRACDQLSSFISYTLDGDSFTIPDVFGGPDGDMTFINAELDSTFVRISFALDQALLTGDFPISTFSPNTPNAQSSLSINEQFVTQNVDVTVSVSRYDDVSGGIIEGTFGGTFDDTQGLPHTITDGEFRVIRF